MKTFILLAMLVATGCAYNTASSDPVQAEPAPDAGNDDGSSSFYQHEPKLIRCYADNWAWVPPGQCLVDAYNKDGGHEE